MKRAGAATVFLLVALAALPANAATTAVGWWTRSPVASAPEGGLTVGNAPDGPLSVGAVGVDLGDGVSSAMLTLEQTGGSAPPAGQLVACIVGGGFEPAAGAPLEEAPAMTCPGASVPVTVSSTTWRADLRELVADTRGQVAIAIVPATGSTALFDVKFDPPSFASTPASSSGSGGSTTATTTASQYDTRPATTMSPRPATPPTYTVPRPPTVAAPVTTTSIAVDVSSTAAGAIPNLDASSASSFGGGDDDGPKGRPIAQAVTMVVLAAVVGVLGGVAHRVVTARAV